MYVPLPSLLGTCTMSAPKDLYKRVGLLEPDHAQIKLLAKQRSLQQQRGAQADAWKLHSLDYLQDYVQGRAQHALCRKSISNQLRPCDSIISSDIRSPLHR